MLNSARAALGHRPRPIPPMSPCSCSSAAASTPGLWTCRDGATRAAPRSTSVSAPGCRRSSCPRNCPSSRAMPQCKDGLMREYDRGYSEVTFATIRRPHRRARGDHPQGIPSLLRRPEARRPGQGAEARPHELTTWPTSCRTWGWKAIHPKAAKTLRQADVPLRVTNAFEPEDPGTLIDDKPAETPGVEIVCGLNVVAAGALRTGHGRR